MLTLLTRRTWHGGRLLAFSALDGTTDYAHGLVGRTSFEQPGIDLVLPAPCSIRFRADRSCVNRLQGDCFRVEGTDGPIRGAFLDAGHLLIEGPCDVVSRSDGVAVHSQDDRVLLGSAGRLNPGCIEADLDAAIRDRGQWLHRHALPAGLADAVRPTLAGMLSILKTQVCSPEGRIRHTWTTPDRWPHRNLWLWDSVFHAAGWRHLDPALARNMLSAVLDAQRDDGFVPHMATPDASSDITQPPLLAFGTALIHQTDPDPDWLAAMYPRLCAYVQWDFENRDTDGNGLAEWLVQGDPHCRSGESGMDNSPRFDASADLDAVDFNAFLALECETLASLAKQVGRDDEARVWELRHRILCMLIRSRLWSDAHGLFVDRDLNTAEPSPVLSSAGFLPLICGAASPRQAARLAAHLRDPRTFGTACPIPSIAACDTDHYAKDMWRGPAWVNINWLIARGFERYGMTGPAATLRRRTMNTVDRWYRECGTAFEFYDDCGEVSPPELPRKGRCAPATSPLHQVVFDYGWTAALYVDLAFSKPK